MADVNVSDIPTMVASEVLETLRIVDQIDRPLMIWGSPGVGKSTLVKKYADKIQARLIDVRLSQYDAVDLRGLPDVGGSRNDTHEKQQGAITTWHPPSTLPFEGNPGFFDDQRIILFLDELLQADTSVQAVAFQLVLDRKIGEHKLKDNVRILAASNREEDRAGGTRILPPLSNRLMHIEMKVDHHSWLTWARDRNIHESVVRFLEYRPDLLDAFGEAVQSQMKAFPTPRTWESVSGLLEMTDREHGIDGGLQEKLIAGLVGRGAATEFQAFHEAANDELMLTRIFDAPDHCEIPNEPSRIFATVTMLLRIIDDENAHSIVRYISRFPAEYQMKLLADLNFSDANLIIRTKCLMDLQTALIDDVEKVA